MEIALSHNNMDFDSLSAQYALTRLHPACRMVLGYPLTGNVRNFVSLNRDYLPIVGVKYIDMARVSRFFLVDSQHLERLDGAAQKLLIKAEGNPPTLSRPLTIYDHHDRDPEALIAAATPDSQIEHVGAATTLIVEQIMRAGIEITEFDATVMAIGIFEDTGSLTYSGTTARDAQCVSFLIGRGADLSVVREYIRPKLEHEQVELFERLLKNTGVITAHGHRFAVATTDEPNYIEGLGTITRQLLELNNVDGAFTVAFMRDRVHIVGRCDVKALSVRAVLQQFGGDGHDGAAAAVVKGASLKLVQAKLIETIEKMANHQPLARELMVSPVRTIRPDITMDEAGRLMLRYGLDGLVVAEGDRVVGIVSRRDIDQSTHHRLGHARVSGFMSKPVITISENTSLGQIQQMMVTEDIGRLPVMDGENKLVGLVSRQDVLNSLFGVKYSGDRRRRDEIAWEGPERRKSAGGGEACLAEKFSALDADTVWLAKEIGRISSESGMVSYAVGGFVRDLLLGVPNFDLDFVVEGSAGDLADRLVEYHPGRFELRAKHDRFQTATLVYYTEREGGGPYRDVDLSTARIEIYEKPAALPEVEPSKLEHDLLRRDFTINALAVCLNPNRFGVLIDHFNGQKDLELKVMRILHPFSFIEDPTRIVRAARFAGRLGFHLEPKTKDQARRAIAMGIFEDLGGVRIKEELRSILESPSRIKALNILGDLSDRLCYLDGQLEYNLGITKSLRRAERLLERYSVDEPWIVYLGVLLSQLAADRVEGVLVRLQLTNKQKEIVESGLDLHRQMPQGLSHFKRSEIYELMHGRPRESLAIAAAVAGIGTEIRRAIKVYLEELADTRLEISGGDLIGLGHRQGPQLGQALRQVMAARLDRQICSRQEQLQLAEQFLGR